MDLPKAKLAMIYSCSSKPLASQPKTPRTQTARPQSTRALRVTPTPSFLGYLQHLGILRHLGHGRETGAQAAHSACLTIALAGTMHPLPRGQAGQAQQQQQHQARQPRAMHVRVVVDKSTGAATTDKNRTRKELKNSSSSRTINNNNGDRKCAS